MPNIGANRKDQAPPSFLIKPISNVWRNRILVELHRRSMSPKHFAAEYGLSLATSARYFRELKDWGFLEIAEERRGGNRRGAVEKIYRAIRTVHFDTPHWEALPLYLREKCTNVILEGLLLQITEALDAGTFDAKGHRSLRLLSLDRQAWHDLVNHLDEILYWLSELEAQADTRLRRTGGDGLRATVSLLCFRSPATTQPHTPPHDQAPLRVEPSGPYFLMSPKTAKALSASWRNRILVELHTRPMSPNQFFDEIGGPDLGTIARHFRQLRDWGHLEVLEKRPGKKRQSVFETVYRAVPPAYPNLDPWESLPPDIKSSDSGRFVETLIDQAREATAAGTMDAETDRHLSWKSLLLDRQAWRECLSRLAETQSWVKQLETEAAKRHEAKPAEWIPATAAFIAFRSPDA